MTLAPTPPQIDLELTVDQARLWVCDYLSQDVPPQTFYRWRSRLGWVGDGFASYPPKAVEALAVFGRWARVTRSLDVAKEKAITYYTTQG